MNDINALLLAVLENPDEDTPRLMYADALDERGEVGDQERAEFIRVQVQLAHTPEVAVQCIGPLGGRRTKRHHFGGTCTYCTDTTYCPYHELTNREREVWDIARNKTWSFKWFGCSDDLYLSTNRPPSVSLASYPNDSQRMKLVVRGFLHELECTAESFLKHADELLWHPTQTAKSYEDCHHCGGRGYLGRSPCDRCVEGKRVVETPRPCPPTAQPIRKVVLTTDPRDIDHLDVEFRRVLRAEDGLTVWRCDRWPTVEFELPTGVEDEYNVLNNP